MKTKLLLPILATLILSLFLSACGANSPASTAAKNTPAPTGGTVAAQTGITMTVNFPKTTALTGLNALISASTKTLSIAVVDRTGGLGTIIGLGNIVAPVGGGIASTTIYINAGNTYSGSIDVHTTSTDAAGAWLGYVVVQNIAIAPHTITPIAMTLVEIQQGMVIPVASSPVITSPDGSTFQVTKVFLNRFGTVEYNMGIEANVTPADPAIAPYVAVNYASTYSNSTSVNPVSFWITPLVLVTNTPVAVYDGFIMAGIQINNPGTAAVAGGGNIYQFSLNFNDLTNTPTLRIGNIINTASSSVKNPVIKLPWTNNVIPTSASTGVTVVIN